MPACLSSRSRDEVEIGRIDADERIRPQRQRTLAHAATDPQQTGQVAQHFGQSHHGQALGRKPRIETGGDHLRTADAGEAREGKRSRKTLDQTLRRAGRRMLRRRQARRAGIRDEARTFGC